MQRLADHVDLLTGFPFKSDAYTADPNGVRLVRGDNVVQGRLRWENAARWPTRLLDGIDRYQLAAGDVVLAMDRPWIEAGLKYARITKDDTPSLLVQRVARLRTRPTMNQGFLYYLIGSRAFTDHVLAVQTGTAVPHISGGQILEFRFRLPPLEEQRAIARALGALDDKVEQNRRTSAALERLARAMFRAWFVDFEPLKAKAAGAAAFPTMPQEIFDALPTRLVDSELGPVPQGWEVKPLSAVATFLNGLALQKFPPRGDCTDLPVIKIAELRQGSAVGAGLANNDIQPVYVIEDGDLLFSWSGTLEVVLWFGGRGALNQHLFKVMSDKYPRWLCLYWVRQHLPWFRSIAASKATTMGHIQRRHLDEAKVVVPPVKALRAADAVVGPMYAQLTSLMLESRKLGDLCDYLLPKLLSGKVRVR
jgi:type I restriction enzyme S subunit